MFPQGQLRHWNLNLCLSAGQTERHVKPQDILLSPLPTSHKPREGNATKQPPSPREILPSVQALTGSSCPSTGPQSPQDPLAVSSEQGRSQLVPLPWLESSEPGRLAEQRCRNHPALCRSALAAAKKLCTLECRRERERGSCRLGWRGWTDRHRESVDIINPPDGHSWFTAHV